MSQGKDKYDEIAEIGRVMQRYGEVGGYGFDNFEQFAPEFEQAVKDHGLIVMKLSIEFSNSKVLRGKSKGFGLKYLLHPGDEGIVRRTKKFIDDHYDGKFTNEQAEEWIKVIQEHKIENPTWLLKYESKMANKKPRTPEERERLVRKYLEQIATSRANADPPPTAPTPTDRMGSAEMRVLLACEESQAVTIEFRARGIEAFSCDTLPCSGGRPEWHIQGDVTEVLNDGWDMMLAFPPCTYLSNAGNGCFNIKKYGDKARERYNFRAKALEFVKTLYMAPIRRIAIENPVGYLSNNWRPPTQIIEPWHFGSPYTKRTCLWLKGLPPLRATKRVFPAPPVPRSSQAKFPNRGTGAWHYETSLLPHSERSTARSKTFPGIARAMADQWSHAPIQYQQELL